MQVSKLSALNDFVNNYLNSFCSEEESLIDRINYCLEDYINCGTDVDEAIRETLDGMIFICWSDLNAFASSKSWAVEEVVQQGFICLDSNYRYFNHLQTAHQYYLNQMFSEDRTEIITALFLLYLHDNIDENSPEFTKDDFEAFLEYHDLGDVVGFDEFEGLRREFYDELNEYTKEEEIEE